MLTKSKLSFAICDGFSSQDVIPDIMKLSISIQVVNTLPQTILVMVHLFLAFFWQQIPTVSRSVSS